MPRYSIITPTVQRESLIRCCESVKSQKSKDWEHIVIVDEPISRIDGEMMKAIGHPQRNILYCNQQHNDFGNSCRREAFSHRWQGARGAYVYYLDDDNYLAHDEVLNDFDHVTALWAIFPILRYGERFFHDPPGMNKTDTGNLLLSRKLGPWPETNAYAADGLFVESLKRKHPYQAFLTKPIMVMEKSSRGERNVA